MRRRNPQLMLHLQAEREGFEPSVPVKVHGISSAAQSTTLSPLRDSLTSYYFALYANRFHFAFYCAKRARTNFWTRTARLI